MGQRKEGQEETTGKVRIINVSFCFVFSPSYLPWSSCSRAGEHYPPESLMLSETQMPSQMCTMHSAGCCRLCNQQNCRLLVASCNRIRRYDFLMGHLQWHICRLISYTNNNNYLNYFQGSEARLKIHRTEKKINLLSVIQARISLHSL